MKYVFLRSVMALVGCVYLTVFMAACNSPETGRAPQSFARVVADTNPPVTPLAPLESMAKIQLPPGYHVELVAAEPLVQEPVALAWDGNGRMYVAEMNTYMKDAAATGEYEPISRIKRLEDTDGDGHMDKATVFIDSLLLPRTILPVGDRLLVGTTNDQNIWSYSDTNGDGRADGRTLAYRNTVADVRNLEHQNGGLLWNLDNWIYPTRDNLRYKYKAGILLADTLLDNMIGQWGLTTDNYGRLFYSEAGPGLPAVQIQQMPAYGALNFDDQYTEAFTNLWPIIGTVDAQGGRDALRKEDNTLQKFTAGCGQSIFRGDRLPADMQGDYFIAEPVGRVIKRGKVTNHNGKVSISDAYTKQDWLASADMNFRPINTYTGPDGCFYIVDMYHGIIQESEWTTPDSYLGKIIAEKGLYKNRGMGRIYRVVHDDFKRDAHKPNMLTEKSATLLSYLNHPNGWWRDNAQQILIVRNDKSVVPQLKKIATGKTILGNAPNPLARIHALWTLEGLDALDTTTLFSALEDSSAPVRKTAVWASESFIQQKNGEVIKQLAFLKNDPSADVRIQLMLSLRNSTAPQAQQTVTHLVGANNANQMMQFSYATFIKTKAATEAEKARTQNLSAAHRKLVTQGATIFKQLCATCHGSDGRGITMGGKSMPAPPLAGSPRVRGDKIMNIQLLLYGLTGPVDGKTYPDRMPAMGSNTDEWLASVLSYIRNSGDLENKASVVTPEEVKQVRANTPNMKEGFTLQLLEIFKLGRAENTNWKKKEAPAK